MYVLVCVCMYPCTCEYLFMPICVGVNVYILVYMCVVCVYMFVYLCVYASMRLSVYMCDLVHMGSYV